ncbi:MAG: DUF1257 domain-containing protein [Bacteroidales bacterium]|nr:DUF1257 domain-containing protein [Bacteroidales bacterium]
MSHIVEMDIEIKDLECLKTACDELGFTFIEGQTEYKWFGQWVGDSPMPDGLTVEDLGKCDHAIQIPGCDYEVGVVKKKKGVYTLQYDYWNSGGLEKKIGTNAGPIKQEYAAQVAIKEAKRKGYLVNKTKDKNKIKIRITVP